MAKRAMIMIAVPSNTARMNPLLLYSTSNFFMTIFLTLRMRAKKELAGGDFPSC
jgi:hypothetical protein